MSLELELYEERRRKWRRSAFWRGFLVAAILAAIIGGLVYAAGLGPTGPHIARLRIDGIIYDDSARDALFREIADDENARALILRIDSPGGTTAGAEALYASIRQVAEVKPVVALMAEAAASGGYIAAIASDHIVARGNTLTGSIGVIMEYPNLTTLLETIGIEMETIRSSGVKGGPSPFRDLSPEARALEQAMVTDANLWFRNLVSERRGLTGPALDAVATGQVFSGRMALENGLVDAIGGEPEALKYLESVDESLAELPVADRTAEEDVAEIFSLFSGIFDPERFIDEFSQAAGPRLYSLTK